MTFDLKAILPTILPRAIAWAESQSEKITSTGRSLADWEIDLARAVGVQHPERVRILEVQQLPLPEEPELRQIAIQTGLLGPNMVGLTLGYGIFICRGYGDHRIVSHECRHVYQYESAGSISNFLPWYLGQIATVGYWNAPYEIDACSHERH